MKNERGRDGLRGLLQATPEGAEEAAREEMVVAIEAADRLLSQMFTRTEQLPDTPSDTMLAAGAAGAIHVLRSQEGTERLLFLLKTVAQDSSIRNTVSGGASMSGKAGFALHTLVAAGLVVGRETLKAQVAECDRVSGRAGK